MGPLSMTSVGIMIIGWILLHFVWQGAALGAVYAVGRSILPRGRSRYRFGMLMLGALGMMPLLTARWLLLQTPVVAAAAMDVVTAGAPLQPTTIDAGMTWGAALDALMPWLVLAWMAGVLLLSFRAWRQWRRLKILVRAAAVAPLWQQRLNDMVARFGLRLRVVVLCSKRVTAPILVGWIRPVILLPLAVVCDFPVLQVELILAHELAHLRRWDPLVNLFQVVLETLYFYHPVVHWISRDVRNEREICCDQLALSMTGASRRVFATTLAELGELHERGGSLLLAANGGVLLDRVQYMVMAPAQRGARKTPARFVAVLLGAVLMALVLRLEWKQVHRQEVLADASLQLSPTLAPLLVAINSQVVPAWHVTPTAFLPHLTALPPTRATPVRIEPVRPAVEASLPLAPIAMMPAAAQPRAMPLLPPVAVPKVAPAAPRVERESTPSVMSTTGLTPTRIRQPIYPRMALLHGIEGKVEIEFGLAPDGGLRDLRVVRSEPAGVFDQAALRAMQGWRYPVPPASATQRRYRQTMMFVLNAAMANSHASSGASADGEEIRGRANCQVATGTHICRWPGDDGGVLGSSR